MTQRLLPEVPELPQMPQMPEMPEMPRVQAAPPARLQLASVTRSNSSNVV